MGHQISRIVAMIGAVLLVSALSAVAPDDDAAVVDRSYCHVGKWTKAPLNVPLDGGAAAPSLSSYGGMVDGPISGNGDFGLVVGTNEHTPAANQGSWLLMYVDTMHFRDVQNDVGAVGARDESGGKRGHPIGALPQSTRPWTTLPGHHRSSRPRAREQRPSVPPASRPQRSRPRCWW